MLLRTLGGLELQGTTFTRPKPLLLLCFLALEGSKERRYLAELFFAEATDPLNRLAVTLSRLRKVGAELVETDATRARATVEADAARLLNASERVDFERVVKLYGGPFLEGVEVSCSFELEEWVYSTRDHLARQVTTAYLALAERAAVGGAFRDAARQAEAALKVAQTAGLEPEDLARAHTLLLAGRHPHAATLRAEAAAFDLPLFKTADEARRALQACATLATNLGHAASGFVGRARELADLGALLARPQARLVTVVGGGGVGKTRLATESARRQLGRPQFRDGVYVVALEAVSSAALVPVKIAEALALQPGLHQGDAPHTQLRRHLADKAALLVLDNFEHLLDAVPMLLDLLAHCAHLKLLVTSREALHLTEEWLFPLEGLTFETGFESSDFESSDAARHPLDFEATRLFVERARQVQPSFNLEPDTLRAVQTICRRLQGYPLGLELAAGLVRALPCADIAAELARDLDVLNAPPRNASPRHRSLRGVFEHSWQLLSPQEQSALRKLAVFRGGFTRAGAAEVAGATLPTLLALVDKSLLRVSDTGRYDRHPLVAQYTQEKLADCSEDRSAAEASHAAHFSRLAQTLEFEAEGPQPRRAYLRLEAELENFRVAWQWAVTHKSAETFNECAKAFSRYFFREHGEEPAALWRAALAVLDYSDPGHHAALAHLLGVSALEATRLGRLDEAETLAERGLALLHSRRAEGENVSGFYNCLLALALAAESRGRFQQAVDYLQQRAALGLFESQARLLTWGRHFNDVAILEIHAGNYAAAEAYLHRALEHSRHGDNPRELVISLLLLGDVHFYGGDAATARPLYREAAALVRKASLGWGNDDFALVHLAEAALELGDLQEAQDVARELLEKHPSPDAFHSAACELLGRVATARGHYDQADAHLKQALKTGLDPSETLNDNRLGTFHDLLLAFVELWVAQGSSLRAAGALQFLLRHSHDAYTNARAERLLARVRLELSRAECEAAVREGETTTLQGLVRGILTVPL